MDLSLYTAIYKSYVLVMKMCYFQLFNIAIPCLLKGTLSHNAVHIVAELLILTVHRINTNPRERIYLKLS